ncbi:transglycosylase SLT domain-containing protein [Marinobacterium aestuariivivens]|uniref:Transglycosylase SLT domain-containing protein n=1 Tax=Marinobacterium aestuariivivens TaxID=1698799 RepID=A0ABW2A889_9GAMM
MKPLSLKLASLLLCSIPLVSTGTQAAVSDPFAQDRALYQQAGEALDAGDLKRFRTLKQNLHQYPLYPYLEFEQLDRNLAGASRAQVDEFLSRFGDTLLASRLQRRWLNELAQRRDWTALLQAAGKLEITGTHYRCLTLVARLNTGDRKGAFSEAADLWDVGESQPDACDPLFDSWIKAGQLSSDIAYSRFWKAIDSGNPSLARYVERYITRADHKAVTAKFWQVSAKPALLADSTTLKGANAGHGRIAAHGIRALARKDLEQAFSLWLRERERLEIGARTREELDRYFGVRLGKNFLPDLEKKLQRLDPDYRYPDVTEWRIRNALTRLDWHQVLDQIARLPEDLQQSDRWRYWRNVAAESLGAEPADRRLDDIEKLTAERSFYGFLAAETHDLPYDLNDEPARFSQADLQQLERSAAFQRMRELLNLKQEYPARSEWNHAQTRLNPKERHAAAHLVNQWGWHDQAIRGAISAQRWNDLSIRFPQPYRALFDQYADSRGINRTWALSIARQESAFQANVQSRAGARGLMQLMPRTASQTAKRYQVPYRSVSDLYSPTTNIALGTAYLAQMLERFDGNRVFATAAYNAGPHRISRWLEERGRLPLDIWVETIPFDETRNYVQNVLAFGVIYDVRADRATRMLTPKESSQLALYQH